MLYGRKEKEYQMIDSKEKLKSCLSIEKKIYYPDGGVRLPFGIREKDILYSYIFFLRKAEYHLNAGHKFRFAFCKVRLLRMSNRYAIHIGVNVCDEGLSIAHVGPIVIHGQSKIGKNLRIHVGATIGANGGKPPVLGDDVYIGAGAKIIGDISIANGCHIGANAVVCKTCSEENSTLVGVPARVVELH